MARDIHDRAVDPAVWQRTDMRAALARRDIATVYRLLQRKCGISQRRIAALTGQSQSEISEILGGRQVVTYELLCRIADGLGVPRGYLGLAYDPGTADLVEGERQRVEAEQDPHAMLKRMALLAVAASTFDRDGWLELVDLEPTPAPAELTVAHVIGIEQVTGRLLAVDDAFGGGISRDPILAHLRATQRRLSSTMEEPVRMALHAALARLHGLAGWATFDVGLWVPALRHLTRAAEHARHAGEPALVAVALCHGGRVYLHRGDTARALRLLHLGQMAAYESGNPSAMGLCTAYQAWAFALLGEAVQATAALDRARYCLAGTAPKQEFPETLACIGEADLHALTGTVHAVLPATDGEHSSVAIDALRASIAMRDRTTLRALAMETALLATVLFGTGDVDDGLKAGNDAVELAEQIRSTRVMDLLRSLRTALHGYRGRPEVDALADRVLALARTYAHDGL